MEYNVEELSPLVRDAWLHTLRNLEADGHELFTVSLPNTKAALAAYYILAPAEASSNLARYDGLRYGHRSVIDRSVKDDILYAPTRESGFGEEVQRRILLGTYTLSSEAVGNYFLKAQLVRRKVQQDFDRVFHLPNLLKKGTKINQEGVDVIITPTALGEAPAIIKLADTRPVDSLANDVLTVPASLAGIPSISVPVSMVRTAEHKPGCVGVQVMAQWGDELLMFRVAKIVEKYGGIRRGLGLYPINVDETRFKTRILPNRDDESKSNVEVGTRQIPENVAPEPADEGMLSELEGGDSHRP